MFLSGNLMFPALHKVKEDNWYHRRELEDGAEKAVKNNPYSPPNGFVVVHSRRDYSALLSSWASMQGQLRRNLVAWPTRLGPAVTWDILLSGRLGRFLTEKYREACRAEPPHAIDRYARVESIAFVRAEHIYRARFSLFAWFFLQQLDTLLGGREFQDFSSARKDVCWTCKKANAWASKSIMTNKGERKPAGRVFTCPRDCPEYHVVLVRTVQEFVETSLEVTKFLQGIWDGWLIRQTWKDFERVHGVAIKTALLRERLPTPAVMSTNAAREAGDHVRSYFKQLPLDPWHLLTKRLRRAAKTLLSGYRLHLHTRPWLAPAVPPPAPPVNIPVTTADAGTEVYQWTTPVLTDLEQTGGVTAWLRDG